METDRTFLGTVVQVAGSSLTVAISDDLPSSSPIVEGRIYRIGQVGSFIRFPLGLLDVFGVVTRVGSNRIASGDDDEDFILKDVRRWIEVQLVGEAVQGEPFNRGVGTFPTIDDEAHIVTHDDLSVVYLDNEIESIEVGSLATSEALKVHLNLDKLVCRHSAVLGATGSGKSNSVASLIKSISQSGYPNAQIIVIDTHGEYSKILKDDAKVFSVDGSPNRLQLPFWSLAFSEFAWIFLDRKEADEHYSELTLRDLILQDKIKNSELLAAGTLKSELVTADSPIPFDLGKIWYDCYEHDHAIVYKREDRSTLAYDIDSNKQERKGSSEKFEAPVYLRPGLGSSPPYKLNPSPQYSSLLNKIANKARDKRYQFLMNTNIDGKTRDLDSLVKEWIGHDKPVTILDLAGMPSELTDVIVGLITRLVYEVMVWGRFIPNVGRQRPILFVYEEAHAYLPRGSKDNVSGYAVRAVRKVFKEGRKYGIGAMVVSQRPSDLDETILSQCGTFITLRLSNPADQGQVKASIPDSMSGLMDLLPALRTGESIITGEAIRVPSRVRFPEIKPRPDSTDPKVSKMWKKERDTSINYKSAILNWRHQSIIKVDEIQDSDPL